MKKILLSLSLVASLFGSDKVLTQKEVTNVLHHTPIFNKIKKGIKTKGVEHKDFYIITLYNNRGEQNVFVTKDLKYTLLGLVLDNKTKMPIEPDYPSKKFSGNKADVENGVVFSFGNGKKDLYVVTDPECPFCQKFEKISQKHHLNDKYRFHIIFLPLSFHKNSKAMIYYILSGKDDQEKAQRFKETLTGSNKWKSFTPTKEQKQKIDAKLAQSKKAVQELGAKGTPSFYDSDLNEIKDRRSILK